MKMVVCKLKCWVDEEKSFKKLWFSHLSIDLTENKLHFQKKPFPEYPTVVSQGQFQIINKKHQAATGGLGKSQTAPSSTRQHKAASGSLGQFQAAPASQRLSQMAKGQSQKTPSSTRRPKIVIGSTKQHKAALGTQGQCQAAPSTTSQRKTVSVGQRHPQAAPSTIRQN